MEKARTSAAGQDRATAGLLVRADRLLFGAVRWIIILLMSGMTLVVFAQVVFRYALAWPLAWTEEVARFALIWVGFFGAAALIATREHIAVTILPDSLAPKPRAVMLLLADLVVLAVLAVMLAGGLDIVRNEWIQRAPATGLPMGYVYLAVPVTTGLMILWLLIGMARQLWALLADSVR
jgi:TRAP-type transport system small permease protein